MPDSPHSNPLSGIGEDRPATLTQGAPPPVPVPEDPTDFGTAAFHPSTEGGHATVFVPPQRQLPLIPGYEVLNLLGRGGMGVVYRARQIKANRLVALKMIRSGSHADDSELARFLSEAEAIARLQHPHIVQIFDVGEHEGQPFFSLEFCGGGSLSRQLRGTPLPPREAARLVGLLAEAVFAAHQNGVIHRDLKPANVLLTSGSGLSLHESNPSQSANSVPLTEYVPKIADFGLAKKVEDAGQTASGTVLGTPSYMAPEQAAGDTHRLGPAVDIYALGAILYELLTGRPPFRSAAPLDTILQVLHDEPVPPRQLQPKTPRDLETICLKCLHKDASRRYASAAELAADLGRFLRDEPIQARPVGWVERAAKWARRRPAAASLLAVASAATLIALLLAGWYLERERQFNRDLQQERNAALAQKEIAQRNEAEAQQRKQEADEQRDEANTQKKRAQEAERDGRFRLMQMHVSRGVRLMEDRDSFAALPWLVMALKEDPRDEATKAMHRYRIGALLRQSPKLARMFFHSEMGAGRVEFSKDGRKLLSADSRTVRIWDVPANKDICPPFRHDGLASIAASFSPDGQNVVTVSSDSKAHLWNAATGEMILTLPLEGVKNACYSEDGKRVLLTGGNFTHIWDPQTRTSRFLPLGETANLLEASFSRDGRRIVTVDKNGPIGVWDVATGKLLTPALMHKANPPSAAVSKHAVLTPDGKRLAVVTGDGRLVVWQLGLGTGGDTIQLAWQARADASEACFSPDGRRLVSWTYIRAKLWDAQTGRFIDQLEHSGQVSHAAFSPNGRWVVTTSEDLTARVWNAGTGEPAFPPLRHAHVVHKAVFSPDSRFLVTASADGAERIWDLENGKPLTTWSSRCKLFTLSPDARYVVALSVGSQGVEVLDSLTGKRVRAPWPSPDFVGYAAFSPDSRLVVACTDKSARLWEIASGNEICPPLQHASEVVVAAVDPAATRLATGCKDGTIHVWDVATRKEVYPPLRHERAVYALRFRADGRLLLTAGRDSKARVWDAVTGRPVGPFVAHELVGAKDWYLYGGDAPAWSPDGKLLATATGGFWAQAWDATTGQPVGPHLDHSGGLSALMFRPDGGCLLSTSNDCTALQWDVRAGKRLTPAMRHRDFVRDGTYTPDGHRIATVDANNLRIWDAATALPLLPSVKLSHGGQLLRLQFAPDGRRLFHWNGHNNSMNVWDVSRDDRPVEDLVKQTNLLAGHQLDANGGLIPLTRDELFNLWQDTSEEALDPGLSAAERSAWHLRQAEVCALAQQWRKAIHHYDEAIALDVEKAEQVWRNRADAFACLQQWDKALADLTRYSERNPQNDWIFYQITPLLLRLGDVEGYHRHCQMMLERFGHTRNPVMAECIAKGCLLHARDEKTIDRAADLAAWALREAEKRSVRYRCEVTMALAEYRQGRFQAAEQRLDRFLQAHDQLGWDNFVPGYLELSMAQQRQGHLEKAREALKRASQRMDQEIPHMANTTGNWIGWLICQFLHEEAERLLETKR